MKNFELVGIKSPGTVNLPQLGTMNLEQIDDALAEKLWREGLPYLKPTSEYRQILFPDQKPIKPAFAPTPVKSARPTKGPKNK